MQCVRYRTEFGDMTLSAECAVDAGASVTTSGLHAQYVSKMHSAICKHNVHAMHS
jgi:hypothetical protein